MDERQLTRDLLLDDALEKTCNDARIVVRMGTRGIAQHVPDRCSGAVHVSSEGGKRRAIVSRVPAPTPSLRNLHVPSPK
jgi:hypothetical protein